MFLTYIPICLILIILLPYTKDAPPSIGNITPVKYDASSEAKNNTTFATSSG